MATRNHLHVLTPYRPHADEAPAMCSKVATLDIGHNVIAPPGLPRSGFTSSLEALLHDTVGDVGFYDGDDVVLTDNNGHRYVALDVRKVTKVLSQFARKSEGATMAATAHAYLDAATGLLGDAVVAVAYS